MFALQGPHSQGGQETLRRVPRRWALQVLRLSVTRSLRCARLIGFPLETSRHISSTELCVPEHPSVWRTAHSIAHLFMAVYTVARARTREHASRTVQLLSQRDHLFAETARLERELIILRSHRCRRPPKQRSHCTPEERAQILSLMALR